ncbi:MAG TPA: MnhB domain-containing protein [Terriglobales bacterium]|jgi:multicomponent Na+:H+ antiporter subunit B|nr:MnhB domain-containing protein [Terriglobales bacterium]
MRERLRIGLFLVAAAGLAALFWWSYRDLPPLGDYRGPYGDYITHLAVYERHATDTVNAITYDYRGIDTLGEEFILFASVTGVLLLFRKQPEQEQKEKHSGQKKFPEDEIPGTDTVRVVMQFMVATLVVFGIYIASHGQLTPGGGFQGGVILATAPLLIFLAGQVHTFEKAVSHPLTEIAEALGAGGYAIIGVSALFAGAGFLTNWIPLGQTGSLFSSGTIECISIAVGLEVSGSFVLVMYSYLKEIIKGEGGE